MFLFTVFYSSFINFSVTAPVLISTLSDATSDASVSQGMRSSRIHFVCNTK